MGSPDRSSGRSALRIGIDARLVTYRRGIGTYVHHLLHEFARREDPHHFIAYVDSPRAIAELPVHPRVQPLVMTPGFYPFWEQLLLPARLRGDSVDVLHCPANTGPMHGLGSTKLVLTIHDVMFLMSYELLPASPAAYQRLGRAYRSAVVPRAARRAERIITVSHRSAEDIKRFLEVGATAVDVIPEAANANCRVLSDPATVRATTDSLGVRHPFVLAPGALDPRKNTERVLEAFARAHTALGENTQLVLFGLTAAGIARTRTRAADLGIADRLVPLGFVSDEELVVLYNACVVFLYPSLYEGFGLPLLEALACGASVATSHAGSLPEIGGDAVDYADPLEVGSIADALVRAFESRGDRRREAGLTRARGFSWRVTAERTVRAYEAAAGNFPI